MRPKHRHAARHQGGPVHQVAEEQPVPDAHHEPRPEDEGPVVERDERLGHGRITPPQLHGHEQAQEPDDDKHRLHHPSRDVAQRTDLALPLEDREQHDGRADVREDRDELQEGAERHPRLGAAEDVA
jgi:hypothetical protein